MKVVLSVALGAVFGLFAATGYACSYQVNEEAQKADLAAIAMSYSDDIIPEYTETSVFNFRYWESKPSPMCPQEITYVGDVALSMSDPRSVGKCYGILEVKKVHGFITADAPRYTITEKVWPPVCAF